MEVIAWVLGFAIGIPAIVVASYPVHAWITLRRSARCNEVVDPAVPLSIIVPVKGTDEGRGRVLAALEAQRMPGRSQLIFCVEDREDPALPDLRALASSNPDRIRVLVTGPSGKRLGKMHNLIAGLTAATGEWLAFVDSDTILPDDGYLARFSRHLASEDVGLVTCHPSYRHARGVPAALLSGAINHDLLGLFSIQSVWGGLRLANGSCMAIRRDVIEAIGGLDEQATCLLMDVILARRVHRAGYRVVVHHETVEVPCRTVSAKVWWNQAHRWQVGMANVLRGPFYVWYCWTRTAFPAAYILLPFVSGPLLAVAKAAVATRLATMIFMSQAFLRDRSQLRYLWLLPITDVVTGLGCWIAILRSRVEWRGRSYDVSRGGFTRRAA